MKKFGKGITALVGGFVFSALFLTNSTEFEQLVGYMICTFVLYYMIKEM